MATAGTGQTDTRTTSTTATAVNRSTVRYWRASGRPPGRSGPATRRGRSNTTSVSTVPPITEAATSPGSIRPAHRRTAASATVTARVPTPPRAARRPASQGRAPPGSDADGPDDERQRHGEGPAPGAPEPGVRNGVDRRRGRFVEDEGAAAASGTSANRRRSTRSGALPAMTTTGDEQRGTDRAATEHDPPVEAAHGHSGIRTGAAATARARQLTRDDPEQASTAREGPAARHAPRAPSPRWRQTAQHGGEGVGCHRGGAAGAPSRPNGPCPRRSRARTAR